MSIVETATPLSNHNNLVGSANIAEDEVVSNSELKDIDDLSFELGLWLSGLESFLHLRGRNLAEEKSDITDWSKEFRLIHSVLLRSSKLSIDISCVYREKEATSILDSEDFQLLDATDGKKITSDEVFELSQVLKEVIILSEGLLRGDSLNFNEWMAWSNSLNVKLQDTEVVQTFIQNAEKVGEDYLPKSVYKLLEKKVFPIAWEADLRLVLPRFAKTLKWLSVIGEMLANDEPLKTSLVLFARINVQMQEMMDFINNRLLRFPNEEDALFSSLDAAAYTGSIELRKVYEQELKGLAEIRPTPLIYAKIETSYALLNDSLQLTLVNFAQLIDKDIEATDIFPNLQTKEEQSLALRENMWNLLQTVKKAEEEAEEYPSEMLSHILKKFRNENLFFLFYKDMETVDRFIEEILITDKKELVPLLHRFGAYLETLLGQINMRAVLAKHPFEPLQRNPHEMFV